MTLLRYGATGILRHAFRARTSRVIIRVVIRATSLRLLAAACCVLLPLALAAPAGAQAPSSLSVERAGERHTWWRSASAPERWTAPDPAVLRAVRWTRPRPAMRLGELDLLVNRGLLRLRVIVVRVALGGYDVALRQLTERGRAAWSIDQAPPNAALAVNAGQFTEAAPWGWLVLDGRLAQLPGNGPLAAGLALDSAGLHWLDPADVSNRYDEAGWLAAFQSYPVLLRRGTVPAPLRGGGGLLDLGHRDIRLALGLAGDTLIVALTRFAGAGAWLSRLPAGLTLPETAALMGALGARDAVMLDGGLSAQLLVRDRAGRPFTWRGSRKVPLGLVLTERIR